MLHELTRWAESAPVVSNSFYRRWVGTRLTSAQFEVFAHQYYARVKATVGRLGASFCSLQDPRDRIQIWHNIGDELGHGDRDRIHSVLFRRWAESLLGKLQASEGGAISGWRSQHLIPTTRTFIAETQRLCSASGPSAAGALLAQEWHGYHQIAVLMDGYALYRGLYDLEEFHDMAEYFYVHLGRAEKEHRTQAIDIASRILEDRPCFAEVERSFMTYFDLLNDFWTGVWNHAIQPAAGKPEAQRSTSR